VILERVEESKIEEVNSVARYVLVVSNSICLFSGCGEIGQSAICSVNVRLQRGRRIGFVGFGLLLGSLGMAIQSDRIC
jgi:hypothetical protein